MKRQYDVIIIGAGPAGLTAGLYAGRARLKTLILEQGRPGGQIVQTGEIENYPGSTERETGPSLIERMKAQALGFGGELAFEQVTGVDFSGPLKTVECGENAYLSKAVILASGAGPALLGCPGEKELTGKGVSYCATCDGAFFQDLEVYVVGGGDAAVEEAIYLTRFARKVTVIHRRDQLRAAKSIQEKAFANPKIAFLWDSVVKELYGDGLLTSMLLENVKTGQQVQVCADPEDGAFGLFVFIGFRPNTGLYEEQIQMEKGYILTDEEMNTSCKGVFAAGDLRKKSLRQVVTAASDGAIAATGAEKYISEAFGEPDARMI